MGDHNENRIVTLHDEQQQILDLFSANLPIPSVGIYEGKCRYFKANLEWARIIEGHVSWLATTTAWREATGEDYFAIQQILIFLQGIGTMADDEMSMTIRNGIYWAFNDLAKQVVSGRTTDIEVDGEGNVSNPSEEDPSEDLPPDDPATPDIDENKASRMGSALAVTAGVNQLLAKLNTLYGADVTADTALADAQFLINFTYVVEASMSNAIAAYWDARAQGNAQITSLDREDLAGWIYCNPYRDIEVSVPQFVASLASPTVEQKNICIDILNGLEETQWKIWQNTGAAAPSFEYKDAPCEPVPDHEVLIQFGGASGGSLSLKANHRYLFEASGFLQDTDGSIQDAWFHKEPSTSAAYDNGDFNIQIGQALKIEPTQNEVIYSTSHVYKWTVDMGGINASAQLTIARDSIMSLGSTSPSNGLLIKIHDLGLIV